MPSRRPKSWSSVSTISTTDTLSNPTTTEIYPAYPLLTTSAFPSSTSPTFPTTSLNPSTSLGLGTDPYNDLLSATLFSSHEEDSLDPDDPSAQSFDFEDIFNDSNGYLPSRPKSNRASSSNAVSVTDHAPYSAAISRLSRYRDDGKLAPVVHVPSRSSLYRNEDRAQPRLPQEKLKGAETRSSKEPSKRFRPTLRLAGSNNRVHLWTEGSASKQNTRTASR